MAESCNEIIPTGLCECVVKKEEEIGSEEQKIKVKVKVKDDKETTIKKINKEEERKQELIRDIQLIPNNNINVVLPGLLLVCCLAALDQSILTTANPTISKELHGGPTSISWLGSSYLLACTISVPLCGRISDLVGRKPILWLAIGLFLFGSIMCGIAKSMTILLIFRGIQGKRSFYGSLFDIVWASSGLFGPLIGGALSNSSSKILSWRWCFFINLPIGGLAFLILFFNLKLNKKERSTFKQVWKSFDKVGYFILFSGLILFLLGFTFAELYGFSNKKTISFIIIGGSLFFIFAIFECFIQEYFPQIQPIIPSRLFRNRTTLLMFFGDICRSTTLMATLYYLPVYYQSIIGCSPIMSGIKMISLSVPSALVALISGYFISKTKKCYPAILLSFSIMTIGTGLMTLLNLNTSIILQEIYPLIFGIGWGILSQSTVMVVQAAMPVKEMAISASTVFLVRFTAFTIGVTVAGSIFNSGVRRNTINIKGYERAGLPADQSNLHQLIHIQPPELAKQVIKAYSDSIKLIWIVFTPIVGIGFLAILGLKEYSLTRIIVRQQTIDELEANSPRDQE